MEKKGDSSKERNRSTSLKDNTSNPFSKNTVSNITHHSRIFFINMKQLCCLAYLTLKEITFRLFKTKNPLSDRLSDHYLFNFTQLIKYKR